MRNRWNWAIAFSFLALLTLSQASCATLQEQPSNSAQQKEDGLVSPGPTKPTNASKEIPVRNTSTPPRPDNSVQRKEDGVVSCMTFEEAFALSTDSDEDGLVDLVDNCLVVPNPDQLDNNEDGIGDICYVLELAKEDLAKRLAVDAFWIGPNPVEVEGVTWENTCLGYANARDCSPIETPGYRAVLMVRGRESENSTVKHTVKYYLYHTDQNVNFRFIGPVQNVKHQFPVWRGTNK